jgi:amidase
MKYGFFRFAIVVDGSASPSAAIAQVTVFVNGDPVPVGRDGDFFSARVTLPFDVHYSPHSCWRGPYGSIVTAIARETTGACAADFTVVVGIA